MEPITDQITNRVAQSDLVVFNLEDLWDNRPVTEFDIAPFLFQEMILREKDFRTGMKTHDWAQYADHHVAVFCSADAIIPTWAWMLAASKLESVARSVALGRAEDLIRDHFARALESADWSLYAGKPVVVKGCGSGVRAARRLPTGHDKIAAGGREADVWRAVFVRPAVEKTPRPIQTGACRQER